ncbi:tail spike protein [Escherichia phage vB_EcoM-RPN242]|nr:tail spike protein [Escherichia phage vB_EcoM-RPN242]
MTRNVESIFGAVVTAPHQIPYTYTATGGEKFISLPFYPVTGIVTINGGMQVPLDNFEIDGNTLNLGRALSKGDVVFCLFDKILSPEDYKTGIRIYKFQAIGGETEFTPDYTSYGVQSLYIGGEYKTPEIEYSYDSTTGKVSLQTALTAGVWVVAEMSVKQPNISPLFDRSIQEIARATNVKDSEVILSTDTTQSLNGKKIIYSVSEQKAYGLPTLPTNVYISSVNGDQLTYNPGGIVVDLLPAPNDVTPVENELQVYKTAMVTDGGTLVNSGLSGVSSAIKRTIDSHFKDYYNVKDFGAVGDGATDDTVAIKAAIAYASTTKGVVYFPDGNYKISSTLALPSNVSVIGRSRESVTITKTTSTTVTVLVTAPALSGGYTGTLPTDMNAVICLGDSSSSRWSGVITGVTLHGTKTTTENHAVEFGIVNAGVVSDATIEDVYIYDCKYGLILPVVFASRVGNNRVTACLGGIFINNGTSCVISTNYSNSCRDYGHCYRDLKYSVIEANACDHTNRNDYYPDRTRVCYGYILQNLLGVTVTGNGQEGTLGINWRLDNFDHSSFTNNTSIRLGSDYTGPSNISWLELNGVARNSIIENNVSYEYNSNGMLFGGAVAGQHHNIYISDITFFNAILRNNIVRSTRNGDPVEAGWLNNVTRTVANSSAKIRPDRTFLANDPGSPEITVQSGTNAVISYGEYTVHNINYVGDFAHIFGVFDVTIEWSSGTSQFISVTGFPVARDYAYIAVTGVNNGDIGFTSGNIPASFRMNIGNTGGAFFTEGEKTLRIDAVVSGKRLYISYDGWYRVSP